MGQGKEVTVLMGQRGFIRLGLRSGGVFQGAWKEMWCPDGEGEVETALLWLLV